MSEVEIVVSDKYVSRGGFGAAKKGVKELNSEIQDLGKSTKGLDKAFASMSGSLGTAASSSGSKIGASLKDSFGKAVSGTGQLLGDVFSKPNPYVYAGAAALGTLAGGAAAGAFTTALGAGIVSIGVVAAAKTAVVRAEFTKLKQDIGVELRDISAPFQQSLIDIANSARTQFGRIKPALADAFKDAAPTVTNFGDSVARAFARFGPAIKPLTDAFNSVLGDLGPRLPGLISRISDAFAELASSVSESPEALGDLIDTLGTFIVWTTDVVRVLNEGYAAVRNFFSGIAGVETIPGKATAAADGINKLGGATDSASSASRRFENALSAVADAEDDTTKKGQAMLAVLDIIAGRTPDYTEALASSAEAIDRLGDKFTDAETKAKGFGGTLLDQSGAFDVTNENGRELYEQVRDVESAFANMAAAVSNGQGSREQFIADANRMRDRLNETWRQAGLTKDQITALNARYGMTPDDIATQVRLIGAQNVEWELQNLARVREAFVIVKQVGGYAGTVNGTTVFHDRYYAHGGVTSTAATGGQRGGDVIMNEQGPEAVRLPNGSTVMPAGATRALEQRWAEGGAGGGPMTIVLELDGRQIATAMVDPLKGVVRKRGGNQEVFG